MKKNQILVVSPRMENEDMGIPKPPFLSPSEASAPPKPRVTGGTTKKFSGMALAFLQMAEYQNNLLKMCEHWRHPEVKEFVLAWCNNRKSGWSCGEGKEQFWKEEIDALKREHWKDGKSDEVFAEINTEEKAYLLGFLAGDGYIDPRENQVNVRIQERDACYIFPEFLKIINSKTPHRDIFYPAQTESRQNTRLLRIKDRFICKCLRFHGVSPKKTMRLNPPYGLSKSLYFHWIRGIWDADGSIYRAKNRSLWSMGITSTHRVLMWIRDTVLEATGVSAAISFSGEKMFSMKYNGRNALRVSGLLYGGAKIALPRKLQKYFDLKKEIEERDRNLIVKNKEKQEARDVIEIITNRVPTSCKRWDPSMPLLP